MEELSGAIATSAFELLIVDHLHSYNIIILPSTQVETRFVTEQIVHTVG
jgi:hypothetical protein